MTRGAGFTLLEMLIAILLTALIGLVLFSSYRNVLESRDHAKAWVAAQEHPRLFKSILDDDISSMLTGYDRRLPRLSQSAIAVGSAYWEAVGEDGPRDEVREDTFLFSFASTSSLVSADVPPFEGVYCIEYVLRGRLQEQAFVRRERPHCGVDGNFTWDEHILLPSVYRLKAEVWPKGAAEYTQEWQGMLSSADMPRSIRFSVWYEAGDSLPEVFIIRVPEKKTYGPQ